MVMMSSIALNVVEGGMIHTGHEVKVWSARATTGTGRLALQVCSANLPVNKGKCLLIDIYKRATSPHDLLSHCACLSLY
jgi:hypothetical protein